MSILVVFIKFPAIYFASNILIYNCYNTEKLINTYWVYCHFHWHIKIHLILLIFILLLLVISVKKNIITRPVFGCIHIYIWHMYIQKHSTVAHNWWSDMHTIRNNLVLSNTFIWVGTLLKNNQFLDKTFGIHCNVMIIEFKIVSIQTHIIIYHFG